MSRKTLKKWIYLIVVILIVIVSYKCYLLLHESNFQDRNYENTKKIVNSECNGSYSFAVFGMAENSKDIFQKRIIGDINSDRSIAFAISTGNAILDGAEEKYQLLNDSLNRLKVPSYIGIGDTEIADGGASRFYKHFGPFYSSFSYGDSYFIFIDTTGTTAYDLQKDWIKGELVKADNYSNKFVFMNDSIIKAEKDYIKDESFRKFLIDEFSKHKVTNVFTCGTAYEKKIVKGVSYYTSGVAGGLSLDVASSSNYYYLKVDVSNKNVVINKMEASSISRNVLIKNIESILIFIHSIFYVQFTNILIALFLILLVILLLYRKASKDVNYYRNFNEVNQNMDINKKLNIAMFTNNYLPFVGGVPISINRLARELRKRGHKVEIFAPEYKDKVDGNDDVYRCKLLYFREKGKFQFAIANIYSHAINKEFKKTNFDIIHVHHPFWMGKKGLRLGEKKNIPIVLTYHTRLEMYSENLPIFKMLFKNILSHRMIRKFAQKCDGIIAPTVSAKEYLENVGVNRQKLVLPTGIDFKNYEITNQSTIENIRNTYVPNGEVLLCSVSRLAVEKNINFLIRGLKLVKENTSVKFKCIIIGSGPERENLQNLVDEGSLTNEIYFIGTVKQEDIAAYYMASELFVFSSLSETQGMVLLEAMAGRCPVVCVRSSGTDDVVIDGVNGYKTSENEGQWSEKVINLLENKEILGEMSMNAWMRSKDFSLEKMAESVERFYYELIASKLDKPMED